MSNKKEKKPTPKKDDVWRPNYFTGTAVGKNKKFRVVGFGTKETPWGGEQRVAKVENLTEPKRPRTIVVERFLKNGRNGYTLLERDGQAVQQAA